MAVVGMKGTEFNSNKMTSQKRSGVMLQKSGVVPPSLLHESRVPRFYLDAIAGCGAASASQLPSTVLVYKLMVTSRLPRHVLGNIWSMVNRTLPGQLTRQEFFSCLALIALTQKGEPLSALSTMSTLPIPNLQACAPFTQFIPAASGHQQQNVTGQRGSENSPKPGKTTDSQPLSTLNILSDIEFSQPITPSMPSSASAGALSNNTSSMKQSTQDAKAGSFTDQLWQNSAINFDITAQNNHYDASSNSHHSRGNSCFKTLESNSSTDFNSKLQSLSFRNQLQSTPSPTPRFLGVVLQPIKCSKSPETDQVDRQTSTVHREETLGVWRRCIDEVHKIFKNTDALLSTVENRHVQEVALSERGHSYFSALNEIHELTMRIRVQAKDKLADRKDALERIDRVWSHVKSMIGSPLQWPSSIGQFHEADQTCGICLTSIPNQSLLEFTGTTYHKQCANLWINRIDSLLPKLSQKSLNR